MGRKGDRHTSLDLLAVERGIARGILRLLVLLLLLAAEHLFKEAELGMDGAREGEEEERDSAQVTHRGRRYAGSLGRWSG